MSSIWLIYPMVIPILAGILCLLIPNRVKGFRETISLIATTAAFIIAFKIFRTGVINLRLPLGVDFSLFSDKLSSFILFFITLFGVLIVLYSFRFMAGKSRLKEYYAYVLGTVGVSAGAVLADNLIVFLVFWGLAVLLLYGLLSLGSYNVASKGLFIIGASDSVLILGVCILWHLTGTLSISQTVGVPVASGLSAAAFILMMIGAIAKAGSMPFHTWIPDAAGSVPTPVMALLPASLDKLLGIYLLTRICVYLFKPTPGSGMSIFLMFIGSFTIVAAVMMALVQHDLKRLLSYHAVSQVGYMVLGIGTAVPVGIAGGLFHMLNNAIYKCSLFLCGGSVEHRTGTTDLDKLGGLARAMPVTFITCLIAALAISGVPPLNGFFSKWMVYQGLIDLGKNGDKLWFIWLVAAMFGSALTLASFMKLIHSTFLGQPTTTSSRFPREVPFSMWIPTVVLAALCLIFGVFAYQVPLRNYIFPSLSQKPEFSGFWAPTLATILIIIGILIGALIYFITRIKPSLRTSPYIGGEEVSEEMRVSGTGFYNTIKEMDGLREIYTTAEKGLFDFYNWGSSRLVSMIIQGFRKLHTGVLTLYFSWCLIGIIILLLLLMR